MEPSKVYFTNLRTTPTSNLLDKMERLVKRAGITNIDFKDQFTAIKIHFGEPGNLAYIRPNYAARLANLLRELGAKPFLTDCNTLYSGRRSNAVDHLRSAMENGFNPISAQCDVIIADGLKGTECREIPLPDAEYCPAPKIGSAVADADIVISMNHFKGHEQAGFGGALKNLGMGAASVAGKMELHGNSQPRIDLEKCKGCNICIIPATDYEPKKAARQYLVQCANLMPEAVELLGKCAREIQNRCDFCAGSYGRACIGCSNLETRSEIHALLAKLEGGMGE